MSANDRGAYSALQKIKVTCNTCGISESYYSNLSVEHFKLSHRGHEVVGGEERARPSKVRAPEPTPEPTPEPWSAPKPVPESDPIFASIPGHATEPLAEPPVEPVRVDEVKLDPIAGIAVSRVIVDLLVFPALPRPVLRVRGFREGEEAFVITVSPEGHDKVKEILAARKYDGLDGLSYAWQPDVVEYSEDARLTLGLPEATAQDTVVPQPIETEPTDGQVVNDSVAAVSEELIRTERETEPRVEAEPPPPQSSFPTLMEEEVELEEEPEPSPQSAALEELPVTQATPVAPDVPLLVEVPTPAQPPRSTVAKPTAVVLKAPAPLRDGEDEEPLLVSKSWYIQKGNQSRKGAVGISNVLKEFRWKVEPEYTIGVMLDDILSVESTKNQISRRLIRRIEAAGYKLTAVVVDQGKPVAWFKRAPPPAPKLAAQDEPKDPVKAEPQEALPPIEEDPSMAEDLEVEPETDEGRPDSVAR